MPQARHSPFDQRSPCSDAAGQELTIPPVHGRAGRGWASILPHLARLKQSQVEGPFRDSDFVESAEPWSVVGSLAPSGEPKPR